MKTAARHLLPLLVLLAVLPLLLAPTCGGSDDDDTSPTGSTAGTTTAPTDDGDASPNGSDASPAGADVSPTANPDRDVEVLDFGFTALRGGLSGGFIAENKSQTEAVEIPFIVVDDAGADISGSHGTVVLMPGETHGIAFTGSYQESDPVDAIEVQLDLATARWTAVSSLDHLATNITTTETQSIDGIVANPFPIDTGSLWLHVIAYDAGDNIIGGSTVGLPSITASSNASFTAQVPFVNDDYANNARIEAYAEFQNTLPPALAN